MPKQETTEALKRALANLATNLTRVVRGARKAYLKRPADEAAFQQLPNFEQSGADLPEIRSLNDDAICTAALEVVASSLIGQERQHDNAVKDLHRLLDTESKRRLLHDKERRQSRAKWKKTGDAGRKARDASSRRP